MTAPAPSREEDLAAVCAACRASGQEEPDERCSACVLGGADPEPYSPAEED